MEKGWPYKAYRGCQLRRSRRYELSPDPSLPLPPYVLDDDGALEAPTTAAASLARQ